MGVTSCQLNNLLEKKLYQIQVVAINVVTNFRSQSDPVFIETLPKPLTEDGCNESFPMIACDATNIQKVKHVSDKESSKISLPACLDVTDIKANNSSKSLNEYLLAYQNELRRTKDEYELNHTQLDQEISKLDEELKSYKREYEQETGTKIRKDFNVKDLEKKRDNLTFQKSKLAKELKSFESTKDIHRSELNDLKNKIKKLTERKLQIQRYEQVDRSKVDSQIKQVMADIELIKKENDKVDEVCKALTTNKKELSAVFNNLKPLVESFNNETIFSKEGNLTPKATEILDKLYRVQPTWSNEITNEIYSSVNFEINWKSTFRSEIRKYLSIQHSFEIAKMNLDKTYQPAKMSEHQASIEFGGFGNALPKKYKRNFSPLTTQQSPSYDDSTNDQSNEWYNFYGQVYSNDSNEHLQSGATQGHNLEQFSDQILSQGVSYDESMYNQMDTSAINSPVQEDARLQGDLLSLDLLAPEVNTLLNNDSYYGYQPSLPNLNSVWNSGIDTRVASNIGNIGNPNISNPSVANPTLANTLSASNMSNSNPSLNFGLNNYSDFTGNYNDINRLPYSNDINLFNPVDLNVPNINNSYFASSNPEAELSELPTSATNSNSLHSPMGSLLSPPPHTTHPQKDFGNLWLDKPYSLHNRTVSGSNSQIWRNDLPLAQSHNFNLQLFSSTPSLHKNNSDLDLNQNA